MSDLFKILHVMPQIGTGGAERQLMKLILHSGTHSIAHRVLYYGDSNDRVMLDRFAEAGISHSRIPRNRRCPIRFLMALSREIRKDDPQIVHCWLDSGNLWGRMAAILARSKHIVVAWRNSRMWPLLPLWGVERLRRRGVHHLANSHAVAESIRERLRLSEERFTIIHNGIDCTRYGSSGDRHRVFCDVDLPNDCKIIATVGSLKAQKNHRMVIQVAAHAKACQLPFHFVIAGRGSLLDNLTDFARQSGVADRVHFLGLRSDIPEILSASDMFLFTSDYEGFPNAVMEAMASALPTVTTDFIGIEELVTGADMGTIVPQQNAIAALNGLKRYYENPILASQVGANAARHVQNTLSTTLMVKRTNQFYRRCFDE